MNRKPAQTKGCGAGAPTREQTGLRRWINKERKIIDMVKTTLKIEGMMCGMCEAHICDVIRRAVPDAKKVSASHTKKEAAFLTEAAVDTAFLKRVIDETGYTCVGAESAPYEKKGWFGRT